MFIINRVPFIGKSNSKKRRLFLLIVHPARPLIRTILPSLHLDRDSRKGKPAPEELLSLILVEFALSNAHESASLSVNFFFKNSSTLCLIPTPSSYTKRQNVVYLNQNYQQKISHSHLCHVQKHY